MRIWTLHPKYLDAKGLVALWRETLLAQKVLQGQTRGYRDHPQLIRFRSQTHPLRSQAAYLRVIHRESVLRNYRFNASKIDSEPSLRKLDCTRGQLLYEWQHLKRKLKQRNPYIYAKIKRIAVPEAHPLFVIVDGDIESWEQVGLR